MNIRHKKEKLNKKLFCAIIKRDKQQVYGAITLGANVNAVNDLGQTPLHLAAQCADFMQDMSSPLLMQQANLNATDTDGNTPLHIAARRGLKETCELFLNHGASLNAINKSGNTALEEAKQYDQDRVVKFLNSENNNTHQNKFINTYSKQMDNCFQL